MGLWGGSTSGELSIGVLKTKGKGSKNTGNIHWADSDSKRSGQSSARSSSSSSKRLNADLENVGEKLTDQHAKGIESKDTVRQSEGYIKIKDQETDARATETSLAVIMRQMKAKKLNPKASTSSIQ